MEVTLTYKDESGQMRHVVVRRARFTIGRGPDNDLVIRDLSLSRSHVVIDSTDDRVQITDCGSRNGTMVNSKPIAGAVGLSDGDVITLGGACDLAVTLRPVSSGSFPLNQPVIAGAAALLILLIAGALLVVFSGDDSDQSFVESNVSNSPAGQGGDSYFGNATGESSRPEPDPTLEPNPTPGADAAEILAAADTTEQIGRAVKRMMTKISNDNAPYIPESGINDVARKVEEYRGSSALREKLRLMKRGCPRITARAQGMNLKPALVMYAALAASEGEPGGDPVTAAERMMPKLLTLRATFGTETANSSLLLVAAYPYPFNPPIGSQTRTPHPLAFKLVELGGRRSTVDTSEARSVWFLHERNGITPEAYGLVIRLLAIGIIAQNPGRHGIEAEPLLC